MKKFENDKTSYIVPKILGGLSITYGVIVVGVVVISIPIAFIPEFRPIKLLYIALVDLCVYGVASFVDVSSKGSQNLAKSLFSKDVEAVKIKSLKSFKGKNDS